jgi:hypothetical protein
MIPPQRKPPATNYSTTHVSPVSFAAFICLDRDSSALHTKKSRHLMVGTQQLLFRISFPARNQGQRNHHQRQRQPDP